MIVMSRSSWEFRRAASRAASPPMAISVERGGAGVAQVGGTGNLECVMIADRVLATAPPPRLTAPVPAVVGASQPWWREATLLRRGPLGRSWIGFRSG